jgi:hypothetical protein
MSFADKPGFWEVTGYSILGFVVYLLTIIPGVGLLVVLGCGYLMFNYFNDTKDLHWIPSIIIGIAVSFVMGALFKGGQENEQEMNFPFKTSKWKKY